MKDSDKLIGFYVFLFLLLIVFAFGSCVAQESNGRYETIHVKKVVSQGSDGKWLVLADKGEYEDRDSMWHGKWDSTTVANQLEEGGTYTVYVTGPRVPLLSWYPNIVKVDGALKVVGDGTE